MALDSDASGCSDAEEDKETTPPQKLHAYFSCSTPIRPDQSIGMELRGVVRIYDAPFVYLSCVMFVCFEKEHI